VDARIPYIRAGAPVNMRIRPAPPRVRAFPIAVEMAIYGLHFQRVARRAAQPPSTRV